VGPGLVLVLVTVMVPVLVRVTGRVTVPGPVSVMVRGLARVPVLVRVTGRVTVPGPVSVMVRGLARVPVLVLVTVMVPVLVPVTRHRGSRSGSASSIRCASAPATVSVMATLRSILFRPENGLDARFVSILGMDPSAKVPWSVRPSGCCDISFGTACW
jgi:hypothetical protein